jgi:hypothetical protein
MSSNRHGKRPSVARAALQKKSTFFFGVNPFVLYRQYKLWITLQREGRYSGWHMCPWSFAFVAHLRMPEKAFSGAFNNFSRCNNSIYSICTFSAQENLSRPCPFDRNSCISWYKSKIIPSGTSPSLLLLSDSLLQGITCPRQT